METWAAPVVFPTLDRAGVALCRAVLASMLRAVRDELAYPTEFTACVGAEIVAQKRCMRIAVPDAPATAARWDAFVNDVLAACLELQDADDVRVMPALLCRPTTADLAREVSSESPATALVANDTATFLSVVTCDAFTRGVRAVNYCPAAAASVAVQAAAATAEAWRAAAANVRGLVVMNPDYLPVSATPEERAAGALVALRHWREDTQEIFVERVDERTGALDGRAPNDSERAVALVRITRDALSKACTAQNLQLAKDAMSFPREV